MNVNGIYAKQTENDIVQKQKDQSKETYEKGQVIEGIISKVSDKVSINFSGRELNFSKDTIQNAKEGQIRQFEITDISESSIVLKEVGSSKENVITGNGKALFTTVITNSNSVFHNNVIDQDTDTRNSLKDLSNQMSDDDYKELSEEGFTIEDYELERLERALARIKQQKSLKEDSLNSQVDEKEKKRESVKEKAKAGLSDNSVSELIATRLMELDLPMTKENVDNMLAAMSLAKETSRLNDGASVYLIENQLQPSVQNIYKAVHSGKKSNTGKEAVWAELEEVVKKIIEDAELPVNEENLKNARFLIDNELAVTSENLKYKNLLDEIKERDNTLYALDEAAEAIKNKSISEGVILKGNTISSTADIIKEFKSITPTAVNRALEKKFYESSADTIEEQEAVASKLNLKELKAAQEEIDQESSNNQRAVQLNVDSNHILEITARRQLEEIRLKLTTEAANTMIGKGISIETEGLTKIVEELKQIENSYYQKLMEEVGGKGADQVALLQETTDRINSLKEAPSQILGATFATRNIETVEGLSETGKVFASQFKNANESYEALMTKPRADMGDSIKKAFSHIDEMLESMGLEKTEANARAIRILGYNSIEITEDNINAIKNYDAKVNALFENLTPPVTATLIKNGCNPLKIPIDELNEKATQLRAEVGKSEEESFSEYLVRLEDNKEITKEERSSYIGIYRLLKQVEKTDGAAVGSLVKAGQEVTLNNLLTAVRIVKHGSVNASIDDNFGSLVSLHAKGESITNQINQAYEQTGTKNNESSAVQELMEYQNQLFHQISKEIMPDKVLHAVQSMGEGFGDASLETLKEAFESENNTNSDEFSAKNMERIRELAEDSIKAQSFLEEYGIPDSLNNIAAVKAMSENTSILYDNIQALKNSIRNGSSQKTEDTTKEESNAFKATEDEVNFSQIFDTFIHAKEEPEDLVNTYEKFQEETERLLNVAMDKEEINISDLRLMSDIRNIMNLTVNLSKKEYYNIPLQTEHGITAMNLTVVHQGNGAGNATISMPSETFGNVKAELSIQDKQVKCFITTDSKTASASIQDGQNTLIRRFEEHGLSTKELIFDTSGTWNNDFIFMSNRLYSNDSRKTEVAGEQKQTEESSLNSKKTTTNELYEAAKQVVMYIKQMEHIEQA